MKVTAVIVALLTLLQNFFTMIGFFPLKQTEIDYGGIPYEEPVIVEPMTIIKDGASEYRIVLSDSASVSERTAAEELQYYLREISGVTLPIVSDSTEPQGKEICLGQTSREGVFYTVDRSDLGDEGFILKVFDERLVIAGGALRGTLYGVYTFLEERLGVRWFTPDLTVIPEASEVIIDKQLEDKQVPVFEYRDDYWLSAYDCNWKPKQKLNSCVNGVIDEKFGGGISYAYFAHSMEWLVPAELYDEHPEYFSYRKDEGKRTLDQRCLTNPDVLAITIENARRVLQSNPNAKIISITQNDNQDYCQCANCQAMDNLYGGPSGTNIWFVNHVAEALEDEFPNVQFDTFAYQYTRSAPTGIVPRHNVIVRLCSIECCFAHPLEKCGAERGDNIIEKSMDQPSSFARDIKNWSEISENLYVWDYTTNFREYLLPFPNFHVLSPNMQFFMNHNVKGVFEQGNHTGGKSGEFGELRAYIIAKLLWNPYADVEYHMMDFMRHYYGVEAAEYIKEYIDFITNKNTQLSHLFIFNRSDEMFHMTASERKMVEKLWENALNSDITEQQRENIERSYLSYRYYKATKLYDEFSLLSFTRMEENKKLHADMKRLGIKRLTEWHDLPDNPWFLLPPNEWQ
ncbi:MAG: DUF4838 domain-containing protein [Clostridiales bacterium]|nr:DUF4838 domain-containing protein [Clostridiales bacterium]